MTGLIVHPLRLAALDRMKVLRVPVTKQTSRVNSCPWEYLDWKMVWIDPGLGNGPYLKVSAKDGETVHRVYPRMEAGDRYVKEACYICRSADDGEALCDPPVVYASNGATKTEDYPFVRTALVMPEWAARYIVTLGPPVPCRLGEVTDRMAIEEGIECVGGTFSCNPWRNYKIGKKGEMNMHCSAPTRSLQTMWDLIYPRHPYSPELWTWGYPMEWRKR